MNTRIKQNTDYKTERGRDVGSLQIHQGVILSTRPNYANKLNSESRDRYNSEHQFTLPQVRQVLGFSKDRLRTPKYMKVTDYTKKVQIKVQDLDNTHKVKRKNGWRFDVKVKKMSISELNKTYK